MVEAIFFGIFRLDRHSMGSGIEIRYKSVETLEANETQTMGREMAAWQLSAFGRRSARASRATSRGRLTSWVWIDLPVLWKWTAGGKYCNNGGKEGSDDEEEADVDAYPIGPAETLLQCESAGVAPCG